MIAAILNSLFKLGACSCFFSKAQCCLQENSTLSIVVIKDRIASNNYYLLDI